MYNFDDILVLSKAGFTAQQIAALAQTVQQPAPATVQQPVPAQVQQPAPAPVQQPAPAPVQQPAPAPAQQPAPAKDPILEAIQNLTGIVQNGNILQSQQPPKQQTAEDILANIINPPIKAKEE